METNTITDFGNCQGRFIALFKINYLNKIWWKIFRIQDLVSELAAYFSNQIKIAKFNGTFQKFYIASPGWRNMRIKISQNIL